MRLHRLTLTIKIYLDRRVYENKCINYSYSETVVKKYCPDLSFE